MSKRIVFDLFLGCVNLIFGDIVKIRIYVRIKEKFCCVVVVVI